MGSKKYGIFQIWSKTHTPPKLSKSPQKNFKLDFDPMFHVIHCAANTMCSGAWRNNIRSRPLIFIETDQDEVRGDKKLAQIFSRIIFLLQKKSDFSSSILSARMQYVGKFLQNSQEINKMYYSQQLLTSYLIKHLSQWLKCRILSYWPCILPTS